MPGEMKPANSLFDLIARSWPMDAAVTQAVFNEEGGAVAFSDGKSLSLAPVADPERPETRVRVAADSGRQTISPRKSPVVQRRGCRMSEDRLSPMERSLS